MIPVDDVDERIDPDILELVLVLDDEYTGDDEDGSDEIEVLDEGSWKRKLAICCQYTLLTRYNCHFLD